MTVAELFQMVKISVGIVNIYRYDNKVKSKLFGSYMGMFDIIEEIYDSRIDIKKTRLYMDAHIVDIYLLD